MKKVMFLVVVVVSMMLLTGCNEAEKKTKVWGQGDTTPAWVGFFGNDNMARLNFVQSQALEKQQAVIYGVNQKDRDSGKVVHKAGLIERITKLEDRLEAVEDSNDLELLSSKDEKE